MKFLPLLLAGSCVVNTVGLALLVTGVGEKRPTPAPFTTKPQLNDPSPETAPPGPALETLELPALIARLHTEGFPPGLIRAIVTSQIHEEFASRRRAIEGEASAAYWLPASTTDPVKLAALRDLAREERTRIDTLLGLDAENATAALLRRTLPTASEEKIAQLAEIRRRTEERRAEIFGVNRGMYMNDDMAKMDEIERTMRKEFRAVLSPQEFDDYELRASRTAVQMHYNLSAFDATEQEFRALFALQRDFDEQFGVYGGRGSPEQARARNEASQRLREEIKTTLGEPRYAEYQRATDYAYRQTSQLMARLDLPPETVKEVYAIQDEIQKKIAEVGRTPATPAERLVQRTTLAAEAEAKLVEKLGSSGYEAYKQYGGNWLQRLLPPQAKK